MKEAVAVKAERWKEKSSSGAVTQLRCVSLSLIPKGNKHAEDYGTWFDAPEELANQ